ncbi:MAG: hypothetical protein AAGA85_28110, partial [Bacteroidota bacterium]
MAYYIDLQRMGWDEYREILSVSDLIPSRRLLLEDVVENFDRIRRAGIANVGELLHLTKTKPMLQSLADELGLDEHYLTVLVREIRSLRPLPIKLKDFPQTASLLVQRLTSLG